MQNQDIDSTYSHALIMQNSTPAMGASSNYKKTFAVLKYDAKMAEIVFSFHTKEILGKLSKLFFPNTEKLRRGGSHIDHFYDTCMLLFYLFNHHPHNPTNKNILYNKM